MKNLVAAAERAGVWAGEPLLHSDEDPAQVLAPETARWNALDEALTEIEAGNETPSSQWKVRFALMLGLERVLSEKLRTSHPVPSCGATRWTRSPGCSPS